MRQADAILLAAPLELQVRNGVEIAKIAFFATCPGAKTLNSASFPLFIPFRLSDYFSYSPCLRANLSFFRRFPQN